MLRTRVVLLCCATVVACAVTVPSGGIGSAAEAAPSKVRYLDRFFTNKPIIYGAGDSSTWIPYFSQDELDARDWFNNGVPNEWFGDYGYSAGYLNVVTPPSEDKTTGRPVIVLVHGGHFSSGNKESFLGDTDLGLELARRGYVVVTLNYTLAYGTFLTTACDPDATTGATACPRGFLAANDVVDRDIYRAIRWLKANAGTYGADMNKIIVGGHSAGAIASLDTVYRSGNATTGINPPTGVTGALEIQAGFSLAGMSREALFGTYGDNKEKFPPTLLMHGGDDGIIPASEGQEFVAKAVAEKLGDKVEFGLTCGTAHNPRQDEAVREISRFLYSKLGLGTSTARSHAQRRIAGVPPAGATLINEHVIGSMQASPNPRSFSTTSIGTHPPRYFGPTSDGYYGNYERPTDPGANDRNLIGLEQSSFESTSFEPTPPSAPPGMPAKPAVHVYFDNNLADVNATTFTNPAIGMPFPASGSYQLRVTGAAPGSAIALRYDPVVVQPGKRYYAGASAEGKYPNRKVRVEVDWLKGDGTALTVDETSPVTEATGAYMATTDGYFDAPNDANSARVTVWLDTFVGTSDDFHLIDDVQLRRDLDNSDLVTTDDLSTSSRSVVGDFNGDGRSDVVMIGPAPNAPDSPAEPGVVDGCDSILLSQPDGTFLVGQLDVPTDASPIVGRFNGDDRDDIFWYQPGTAAEIVWYGKPTNTSEFANNCTKTPVLYPWINGTPCFFDDGSSSYDLKLLNAPIGGTFTMSIMIGHNTYTTDPIGFNAVSSDVETKLLAAHDSNGAPVGLAPGDVSVVGPLNLSGWNPGGPWRATFDGNQKWKDTPQLTADGAGLTDGTVYRLAFPSGNPPGGYSLDVKVGSDPTVETVNIPAGSSPATIEAAVETAIRQNRLIDDDDVTSSVVPLSTTPVLIFKGSLAALPVTITPHFNKTYVKVVLHGGGVESPPAAATSAVVLQSEPKPPPVVDPTAAAPLVGDFDGNGRKDLAFYDNSALTMQTWSPSATTLNATLNLASTLGLVAGHTYVPLVGDFDGNGKDDIAFFENAAASLNVWSASTEPASYTIATGMETGVTYTPLLANFDGDTKKDIGFFPMTPTPPNAGSHFPIKLGAQASPVVRWVYTVYTPVVGDFNGDGKDDIYLHSKHPWFSEAIFPAGTGSGGWPFGPLVGQTVAGSSRTDVPTAVDLTGDGHSDVILENRSDNPTSVLYLTGKDATSSWPFDAPVSKAAPTAADLIQRYQKGDFNGDGRIDVNVLE